MSAPGRDIRVLPPTAAERIAAGEVVERPASVVKELIENSLDSGARQITVEIEGAGHRIIRVSDDGEGIPARDLPLAFQRFATSKIRVAEDLHRIDTYGFRGEALPSIAAVARIEMVTRLRGGDAMRIRLVGGAEPTLGPASGPPGSTVTVGDLFFNTPARRKFLKSPAREAAVIAETVEALALAAPDVAFRLSNDGREVLWYPPERFGDRARRVLGSSVAGHTLDLEATIPVGTLEGVLGTPQVAQPRRTHQWFLVNRRPVRSPLLARALAQAYHTLIPSDRHPAAVLSVRLPPQDVDANIHPRKTEVRFADERTLFEDVVREVRRALHRVPLVHVIPGAGPHVLTAQRTDVYTGEIDPVEARAAFRGAPEGDGAQTARWPSIRVIGQLAHTYIVGESGGDLILIDQHAAHERVLYERLLAARTRDGARAQGLVTPPVLSLTPAERTLLDEAGPAIRAIGFEAEPFGPGLVRLTAVPAIAVGRAPDTLFRACLRDLGGDGGPHAGRSLEERLAIATACHTAVRAGDPLHPAMMADLLDALAHAEDPFSCFHGRPTMIRVRERDLERWFYRRD
ncbi:MAG TPA: DNA mismatch repair endonuclease MutL [bacterium]|nr:DNA mismatch repair endonuclease MutL [bacterium]